MNTVFVLDTNRQPSATIQVDLFGGPSLQRAEQQEQEEEK